MCVPCLEELHEGFFAAPRLVCLVRGAEVQISYWGRISVRSVILIQVLNYVPTRLTFRGIVTCDFFVLVSAVDYR